MNVIDVRTLLITQMLSYALCTGVMAVLWHQNRRRYAGLGFWLANFVMQTLGVVLIVLRGVAPDWLSIIAGNVVLVAGPIFLYVGLERFVGRRSRQLHNGVLLLVFTLLHTYFTFAQPNLAARNINVSAAVIVVCAQLAWLLLGRVRPEMRGMTRWLGLLGVAYCVISVARILVNVLVSPGDNFLQNDSVFDALLVLIYILFFIATTFSLFLMLNRRLFVDIQAQQMALQESEARYRQLIDLSPDALIVHRDSIVVFVNSAMVTLLGAAGPEDMLGKPVLSLVHPDYRDLATRRIAATLATGETAPLIEEKLFRFDGAVIDVEVTTARLEYQGQSTLQTLIRDITARKQAEETIRLRLRLFEFTADHSVAELMQYALDEIGELTRSPIGFYHFVETDQKTLSLQAWSTRTLQEFCKAEGAGMHYDLDQAGVWVDCVRQRKPVIHNDYAALPHRKGMPPGHAEVKRELVVPTMADGRIVAILGVGNKPVDYDEQDVALVAYVADVIWRIIERKQTEEQLQTYQRQLEAQNLELRKLTLALEQSGSVVVITDTAGLIQYVNPRFEEVTGYTVHEALGQNPRILKSGEQSAEFYRVLWDTIANGQIWRGELHNKRKDGPPWNGASYWESATIAPVQDAAGQVTHYIAIKGRHHRAQRSGRGSTPQCRTTGGAKRRTRRLCAHRRARPQESTELGDRLFPFHGAVV